MRLFLLFVACSSPPPPPTPGCDPGVPGLAQATSRPLAVLGDRVSDRLELYTLDPLTPVGCVGVHESAGFINEPFDLASFGDALYVVLGHPDGYSKGTLLELHLPDGAKMSELPLGEEPSMIALTADGKTAYVSLFRNIGNPRGPWTMPGAVVEVDVEHMSLLRTSADLCDAALGLALDEARGKLWVACPGNDQLAIVDTASFTVDQMIPLNDNGTPGSQPAYLVLDGKHAFVTAQNSGDLWIFDQSTYALAKRINFGTGSFPQRLSLVPNSHALLVAVDFSSLLAAVDTDALVVADTIPLGLLRPQGIAVTADSHWAMVTDERDLMQPGHLLAVDLTGLGAGGGRLADQAPAAVFPQAVIVLP